MERVIYVAYLKPPEARRKQRRAPREGVTWRPFTDGFWMGLYGFEGREPPRSDFVREYKVPQEDYGTALLVAEELVATLQGKKPEEVVLPENLAELINLVKEY